MTSMLPLHLRMFNERVRAMNQSNSKLLTLNSQEARNLHTELYELLATIAELSKGTGNEPAIVKINMDGGGFK